MPNQNHFLGRLLVIVSEWDFSALGARQVLLLKEQELKRRFFSFAAVPGFGLEQLPVLGLGTPVRSTDKMLDDLREAEQRHPAMDLVIPDDQTGWEQHLERVRLDPFVFQMHLKMNKQEGGASDLFKLKAPEDFLRLFLELVFDERATGELEKSLAELREKIARAPDRQAAIEFGEELLKSLRPFATEAAERERLRGERQNLRREVASVAAALGEFLRGLNEREAELTNELEHWHKTLGELKAKRDQHQRYARGYERLGRLLLINETEAAWKSATQAEAEARRREHLLDAAIALRVWSRKQVELNACVKQFESLQSEHRPEWQRVRALGAAVKAAWQAEVAALTTEGADAERKTRESKKHLQFLHRTRAELTAQQATADAKRGGEESDRNDRPGRKLLDAAQ